MKTVLMSGYSEKLNSELDQLLPDAEFLEKPLRMKDLTENRREAACDSTRLSLNRACVVLCSA